MVLVKHHLTGYTLKMNDKMYRTYSLYCLLSVFAAFASYRLHLEGFEKVVGDGLDAIINGTGRAPDQYRIFPYLVLAGMKESLSPWFGESWKYSILLFEALSLFGSALFLRGVSSRVPSSYISLLLLIYPFLMFDGVRSIAAFILLMSSIFIFFFSHPSPRVRVKLGFYAMLVLFSFTRADIALLVGLVCSVYMLLGIWEKCITVAIPLICQLLLSTKIFPNAQYYSDLIMVSDNISLVHFFNNPMTYLLSGCAIYYWSSIREFMIHLYQEQKFILLLLAGYLLTVFIVGRPNEYRLFLPMLPIILLILEKSKYGSSGTTAAS